MQETQQGDNMKNTIYLSLILLILSSVFIPQNLQAEKCGDLTHEEFQAQYDAMPLEDLTHDHDNLGMHTHTAIVKELRIGNCVASETWHIGLHDIVEPDPPPPVIEGYTPLDVAVCIAGLCLERDPIEVTGPVDLHGNVPPEPAPGEPELFYPTTEIDGKHYWDSTQEPYQVSEEARNAEAPGGYKLEDIDGQLFLVPHDTSDLTPVDTFFEDPAAQDTLIIYTLTRLSDGNSYLEPTPFHVHAENDAVETRTDSQDPQSPLDTQGSQESSVDTGTGTQESQGTEDGQDIQDGQDSLTKVGDTYASLDGKFYQVTLDPPIPLQVTEYMVRTWGDGQDKLPQWIEIYNPNSLAVNIVGYEFSYVFKKQTHSIELRHFLIPPEGAIILATHIPLQRYKYEGITESQVYNLGIENGLKQGWSLKDPLGGIISEEGKSFGEEENPIMPARVGLSRVSYNVYGSECSKDPYFFGFRKDVSSPGFHEPQIPRSPALLRQKMKTTWASFKKN